MQYLQCGFINHEGMQEDLVVNENGEVIIVSSTLGSVVLSDVNIGTAGTGMGMKSYNAFLELDMDASGVAIGEDVAVLLYDNGDTGIAKFFDMGDFTTPVREVEYTYGDEVEGEISY